MTNKEIFLGLVSKDETDTLEKNNQRVKNRAMLRESQQIAIKVMVKLDNLGWSQKDLAKELDVSPQHVSKLLSGKENLTIETQIKLQNILNIPILASFYENKMNDFENLILTIQKRFEKIVQSNQVTPNYQGSKTVKMGSHPYNQECLKMAV